MRRLLLLLPILFFPAFASAGHAVPLESAAARLEARAGDFYREVAHVRGNWRLKREARQFARLSHRFARQVSYGASPRRLARTMARLEKGFSNLEYALDYARVRRGKKFLRKDLRRLGRSLARVERRFGPRVRLAQSRGGRTWRSLDFYDERTVPPRIRRYRN